MRQFGLPWPVVLLVLLLGWTSNISHAPIGFAEFFAGQGEQSKALAAAGVSGHAHDLEYGPGLVRCVCEVCLCVCVRRCVQLFYSALMHPAGSCFDFNGNAGFALAMNSCVRMLPGAICPLGPVCSSWIFLSRSSSFCFFQSEFELQSDFDLRVNP